MNRQLSQRLTTNPNESGFDIHLFAAQNPFYFSKLPEMMLNGGYRAGKTIVGILKIYHLLAKYPGNEILLIRRHLSDLKATTLDKLVRGDGPWPGTDNMPGVTHNQSARRITFPNRSILWYGGVDAASRDKKTWYKGMNLGGILVDQAEELTLQQWEDLQGRLSNPIPIVRQMIGLCNPGPPSHWIAMRFFTGGHVTRQAWTITLLQNPHLPLDYKERMLAMKGIRLRRFVHGEWIASEGMVYDSFDPLACIIDPFPIPDDWAIYQSIDFGYVHPFVCQWWARSPDDRWYLFREIYRTQRTIREHAKEILEIEECKFHPETLKIQEKGTLYKRIRQRYSDHDASDRATLMQYALWTAPADKDVLAGIQTCQDCFDADRIRVFRDACPVRDEYLTAHGYPSCTAESLAQYEWAQSADGAAKEAPLKKDFIDDGADAMRMMLHSEVGRPVADMRKFNYQNLPASI